MSDMNFGVNLVPTSDSTYSLGSANKKWKLYGNEATGTQAGLMSSSDKNILDSIYTNFSNVNIATFTDENNNILKSLKVAIEPVQDLHGYDNPWPAGGGKNLFDKTQITSSASVEVSQIADGFICKALSAGTYRVATAYTIDTGDISGRTVYCKGVTTNSGTNAGSLVVRFYDANNSEINANSIIRLDAETSQDNETAPNGTVKIIVRAYASGGSASAAIDDTATFQNVIISFDDVPYSPYSNICPITGWTGVNVYRTGKNLFDKTKAVNDAWLSTTTGEVETGHTAYCVTDYIPVKNGISVYIPQSLSVRRWFYDAGKQVKAYLNNSNDQIFTPTEDGYIRVTIKTDFIDIDAYQIEFGSTATAYEPYSGTVYPVTWETEAGTVYGGTLDVVTGELVVDRKSVDLGTLNYGIVDTNRFYNTSLLTNFKRATISSERKTGIVCEMFKPSSNTSYSSSQDDNSFLRGQGNSVFDFVIKDTAYSDTSAFKTAMSGVQLVYELATPLTYTLTPVEIQTLIGQNNVWNDAGTISIPFTYSDKIAVKADKVFGATNGNFAALNSSGNIIDSGHKPSDYVDFNQLEFIDGTNSSASPALTGVTASASLSNGKIIYYRLAQSATVSSNNALTLQLTLPSGSTTGAIGIYTSTADACDTSFAAGAILNLIYYNNKWIIASNGLINASGVSF